MGEELQKAGINTPASKKSSETFRRSTKGSPFEDETNSQPAFGNPKFYQDPEEEEEVDEEGKVVSGREKHLANVVKELLKEENLAGQVNKIEPPPPQGLAQDQEQDDSAEKGGQTAAPLKVSQGGENSVPKNAFRQIVALMGEEEGKEEEGEEKQEEEQWREVEVDKLGTEDQAAAPRNLETEMVRRSKRKIYESDR